MFTQDILYQQIKTFPVPIMLTDADGGQNKRYALQYIMQSNKTTPHPNRITAWRTKSKGKPNTMRDYIQLPYIVIFFCYFVHDSTGLLEEWSYLECTSKDGHI